MSETKLGDVMRATVSLSFSSSPLFVALQLGWLQRELITPPGNTLGFLRLSLDHMEIFNINTNIYWIFLVNFGDSDLDSVMSHTVFLGLLALTLKDWFPCSVLLLTSSLFWP